MAGLLWDALRVDNVRSSNQAVFKHQPLPYSTACMPAPGLMALPQACNTARQKPNSQLPLHQLDADAQVSRNSCMTVFHMVSIHQAIPHKGCHKIPLLYVTSHKINDLP